MKYKDMGEFRALLNGLLARAKPNGRGHARANMGYEWQGVKADTLEELRALMQSQGGRRSSTALSAGTGIYRSATKAKAPRAASAARTIDPNGPVTERQGQKIKVSIGAANFRKLLPKFVAPGGKKGQIIGSDALNALGMTSGLAEHIIQSMEAAKVLWAKDAVDQNEAFRVLQAHLAGSAKANRSRSNPDWSWPGGPRPWPSRCKFSPGDEVWVGTGRRKHKGTILKILRDQDECMYLVQFPDNLSTFSVAEHDIELVARSRKNPAVPRGPNIVQLMGEDGDEWANWAQDRAGVAHRNPRLKRSRR